MLTGICCCYIWLQTVLFLLLKHGFCLVIWQILRFKLFNFPTATIAVWMSLYSVADLGKRVWGTCGPPVQFFSAKIMPTPLGWLPRQENLGSATGYCFLEGDVVDVFLAEIYDNTSLYMSSNPYNTFTGFRIAPEWSDKCAERMQAIIKCIWIFLLKQDIIFNLSIKFVYPAIFLLYMENNFQDSANLSKLMVNWGQFKDPVCYLWPCVWKLRCSIVKQKVTRSNRFDFWPVEGLICRRLCARLNCNSTTTRDLKPILNLLFIQWKTFKENANVLVFWMLVGAFYQSCVEVALFLEIHQKSFFQAIRIKNCDPTGQVGKSGIYIDHYLMVVNGKLKVSQ